MFTEKFCDDYYQSLIQLQPVYVWGANMEKATPELINKLYRTYGSSQYNSAYYSNKLTEAQNGSGWISDCSGMIMPISQKDNTAKGYYANCPERGPIASIDTSHSCLVFRGSSPTTITHVGYYCASTGEVMEMASSKTNFQHKKFNKINWNYWGKPSFIQYQVEASKKPYLYKGIDVSGYQTKLDYNECKKAGVDFAFLKIIRKDLNKDKMFETHWKNFTSVGIPIWGVYNYSYATSIAKAKSDAQIVIKALEGRKTTVCLDIEDTCQKSLGKTLVDMINAYQEVIEAAGLPFILYTGQSFYNSYIKPYESSLKCKDIWMARYYKGYNMMEFIEDPDQQYKPMNNILGWQYTSSGHFDKCPGNYDFNILYKPLPSSAPSVLQVEEKHGITTVVSTKGASLNVRNTPINGRVVRKLPNRTPITLYDVNTDNGWYRINDKAEEWVSPDYVKSDTTGVVVCNALNVRSSDSTQGKIVATLKKEQRVPLLRQSSTSWYLTPQGWISGSPQYLKVE